MRSAKIEYPDIIPIHSMRTQLSALDQIWPIVRLSNYFDLKAGSVILGRFKTGLHVISAILYIPLAVINGRTETLTCVRACVRL
jgi:hypothetical protein